MKPNKQAALRPEHWAILHYLYGHRPIVIETLAKRLGVHPDGICRTLKPLIDQELISLPKDCKIGRKERVFLTPTGKQHVQFKLPALANELSFRLNRYEYVKGENCIPTDHRSFDSYILKIPTVRYEAIKSSGLDENLTLTYHLKRKSVEYGDTVRLWRLLDLSKIELTSAPRMILYSSKMVFIPEKKLFFKSAVDALMKIHELRHDVGYRPFGVKTRKNLSPSVKARCVWISLDLPLSYNGSPLSVEWRAWNISASIVRMMSDGLAPSVVVDSGFSCQVYFVLMRTMTNSSRLLRALNGLANKYGGDVKAASLDAVLPIPETRVKRESQNMRPKMKWSARCEIIFPLVGTKVPRNALTDIEKVLGYDLKEEYRQQFSRSHKTSTPEWEPN